MRRILTVPFLLILVAGMVFTIIIRVGLPMRALPPPSGSLIGAVNALATDTARPDLFSGAAQRVVPFQMLYPASAPGTYAPYMPDARHQIDAIAKSHGWMLGAWPVIVANGITLVLAAGILLMKVVHGRGG